MLSKDIRNKFLEFFRSKKHEVISSDSLVPRSDPTLLFTSAGMNQFKEQFLGHNVTYRRAASCQKCLRTGDLEKVGKTPSHHTFFEMLGNFSFGDYFKKEAIEWAWEFMTKVLGLKEEKLWVSVYKDDEESYRIWRDAIKVPAEKIVKLDAKDNFWPSNAPADGPNGPCGPCSEIFYDWGEDTGCKKNGCNPACDCGRFVEVWNLVFTQFDRKDKGKLENLPSKNIDTGMGLERITAVMQGVKTNFETDLFTPIIEAIKLANPAFSKKGAKDPDINAVADHIRAVTFAIADGVGPSNEERGYVIRKLIRRAYLRGRAEKPYLYNVVPKVVEVMKAAYPELLRKREEISLVVKEEEEKFGQTLLTAMPILEESLKEAKNSALDGEAMFKLVDTYGLPQEVIESEAARRKIKLDMKKFQELMDKRRELSRKKSNIEEDIFALNLFLKAPVPDYSSEAPLKAKILRIAKAGGKKQEEFARQVIKGDRVSILTSPQSSAFYAEAGGQVGDSGLIKNRDGTIAAKITRTHKIDGRVIHDCDVETQLAEGLEVLIEIDNKRKGNIAKNHTATHLLHGALRAVLGEHVHQAGSLVDEDKLRFDFTHMKKMSERELEKVESIVNENIKKGLKVEKEEKSLDEARKEGAIALFGEKYAERVRVVSAGDFSKEVCGGTHVDNTKDIGLFKIIRESSVASGIRRIEAVTSDKAAEWITESKKLAKEKKKAEGEKEERKKEEKEKLKKAESALDEIIKRAKTLEGIPVIAEVVKNANMNVLRSLADRIRVKLEKSFIALGGEENGRVYIILSLSKDLVSKGLDASRMIKDIAEKVEGSGGGRADFAQAGGKKPSGLADAVKLAEKLAEDSIGGRLK